MARTEARIKTRIWNDDDYLALDPNAKFLYLTILSQPKLNLCGVAPLTPAAWSHLTGLSKPIINRALLGLQGSQFVHVDENTEELWVRTLTKNDGILNKPNMTIAMTKDFSTITSKVIRCMFLEGLGKNFIVQLPVRFPKAFGDPLGEQLAEPFVNAFHEQFAA